MSALLNLLYYRFKRFLPMFYSILFLILVIVVCYYVYKNVYLPKMKNRKFQDVANTNPIQGGITIFMFHVDWCPHCKKALPEWKMFSDQYNGTTVNGYQIECKEVDCTKSDDPNIKNMLDKYSLKQYPTIIALVPSSGGKDKRIDYDAKVKKDYLDKFIVSITTENNDM